MDVARTQWQRSESLEQPFSSLPRSHYVNEVLKATCLRCHYAHAILTTHLLVLIASLFDYVLTTLFLNMFKVRPRT